TLCSEFLHPLMSFIHTSKIRYILDRKVSSATTMDCHRVSACRQYSVEEAERIARATTAAQVGALMNSQAFKDFLDQKSQRTFRAGVFRRTVFCCVMSLLVLETAYLALIEHHKSFDVTKALRLDYYYYSAVTAAAFVPTDTMTSAADQPSSLITKPHSSSSAANQLSAITTTTVNVVASCRPSDEDDVVVITPPCSSFSTHKQQQPNYYQNDAIFNNTMAATNYNMTREGRDTHVNNITGSEDAAEALDFMQLLSTLLALPPKGTSAVCAAVTASSSREPAAGSVVAAKVMSTTSIHHVEPVSGGNVVTTNVTSVISNGHNGNLNATRQLQGLISFFEHRFPPIPASWCTCTAAAPSTPLRSPSVPTASR
ncbi:hypothetical protein Vafri_6452, partial [Volvox africanus]